MNLSLLWPAALFGVVALLLPVLLHRLPRRQSKLRRFAALRFIGRHASPRQQKRISEWWLLALRLGLLSSLLLWLALPVWRDWVGLDLHWRAVWPGVSPAALASATPADRSLWLLPNFPDSDRPPAGDVTQAASLLRQLATEVPPNDRLSVLVPAELSGLDADALSLARPVQWELAKEAPPEVTPGPLVLAVRLEANAAASPWLEAALAAWQQDPELATRIDRGDADRLVPEQAKAVLWLGNQPAPRFAAKPVPWLQIPTESPLPTEAQSVHQALPWESIGAGNARLLAPLTPAAIPTVLDPDFPHQLHALLFQREPRPSSAPAASIVPTVSVQAQPRSTLELHDVIALLIAVLLLLERWVASGRRLARPSA